ncbi:tRNA ligase [Mactra antiquata]
MLRSVSIKTAFLRGGTWSRCQYVFHIISSRCLSEVIDTQDGEVPPQNKGSEIRTQPTMPRSRTMDRTPEDLYRRYLMNPDQPKNSCLLRVAIIGAPNAGKSSLVNSLMGWKVTGVSKKVHTTRANTNSVFNIENTQVVLVDTPGVINHRKGKRHHCESSLIVDPERSVTEADVVGVIVDAADKWTRYRLSPEILKVLCLHKDVPSFLILNKIDELRNKPYMKQQAILLDVTHKLSYGVVGGKSFGRTVGEVRKKKVIDPAKDPDELFKNLEKKYGKLKVKSNDKLDNSVEDMFNKHMRGQLEDNVHVSDDFGKLSNEASSHFNRLDDFAADKFGVRHVESGVNIEKAENLSGIHDVGNNKVKTTFLDNSSEVKVDDNTIAFSKDIADESKRLDFMDLSEDLNKDIAAGHEDSNNIESKMESLVNDVEHQKDALGFGRDFNGKHSVVGIKGIRHEVDSLQAENSEISKVDVETNTSIGESEHFEPHLNIDNIIKETSYQSDHLADILSKTPLDNLSMESSKNDNDERDWLEKVDAMKEALRESRERSAWENFDRVFLTSTIDGTGIDDIKQYFMKIAKPSDWVYHSSVITDQHPYDIAKMCIKQSFLEHIDTYLPYTITPEIVHWEIDDYNRLNIVMDVIVDNSYEMKMLLKQGANKIKAISADARQALMDAFQCDIRFKLIIKQRQKRKK